MEKVQQTLIDALDQGEYVHILGTNGNRTDLNVQLHPLNDPAKETIFENCVADVNIPVGEVFYFSCSGRNERSLTCQQSVSE